jgi:LacI family transcriptional regulator
MMQKRTTIGDIAAALGMSRNTVSKALNDNPCLPASTRQRIIEKAVEMNYKSLGDVARNQEDNTPVKNIILVCKDNQLCSSFFGPLIHSLHEQVRNRGGSLITKFLSAAEIAGNVLPAHLSDADGVFAMELLDAPYIQKLVDVGLPVIFFDFYHDPQVISGCFDIIMEHSRPVYTLIRELIKLGASRLGFIGNIQHCFGFKERYDCFRMALADCGIHDHEVYSMLNEPNEVFQKQSAFEQKLRSIQIPDVFMCANDYIAINLIKALNSFGIDVPGKVQVTAFDNISEGLQCTPQLTTISIERNSLASAMTVLLFDRIENPETPRRILYTAGNIIYRQSTRT